ncbi:IS66 Orf2 like protein [Serratia plymuthica]|uniref:IS66 Orf2 like protein n=1 Tax=Serratia plymuthica TaxID=82996 RepID=A0A2X4UX01_SERPL|nr:IS66 Orf2 like protein [Serratia plymuthica]SQI43383.1 IS66 Orf2 like protein [Serratia plymuthica]
MTRCGHVFIFRGRSGNQLKLLWSTGNGLCLLTKRLECGRFACVMETEAWLRQALARAEEQLALHERKISVLTAQLDKLRRMNLAMVLTHVTGLKTSDYSQLWSLLICCDLRGVV